MIQYVEIKPHPWITTNALFLAADRSHIVKVHRPKKRHANYYKYRALRSIGFPVPYEFRAEAERCAHEREIYRHWYARGFAVPRLIETDAELPGPPHLCIVLEFIEGRDLWALLGDGVVPRAEKLQLLASLFAECAGRHARVFADRDRRLIKYDGNLRNVIVRDGGIVHVDFECGRIAETLTRGAARELARYATDAVRAMGRSSAGEIAAELRDTYQHVHVLKRVVREGQRRKPDPTGLFNARDLAPLLTS